MWPGYFYSQFLLKGVDQPKKKKKKERKQMQVAIFHGSPEPHCEGKIQGGKNVLNFS